MNNIWSLSKSSRYTDRSESLLVVLAVVSIIQIAACFNAGKLLLPSTQTAALVAPAACVLSTNAPIAGAHAHAGVPASLALPAVRS